MKKRRALLYITIFFVSFSSFGMGRQTWSGWFGDAVIQPLMGLLSDRQTASAWSEGYREYESIEVVMQKHPCVQPHRDHPGPDLETVQAQCTTINKVVLGMFKEIRLPQTRDQWSLAGVFERAWNCGQKREAWQEVRLFDLYRRCMADCLNAQVTFNVHNDGQVSLRSDGQELRPEELLFFNNATVILGYMDRLARARFPEQTRR